MRVVLASLAAGITLGTVTMLTPVAAADLGPPQMRAPTYKAAPPIAMYNWTGFYIGANIGHGWSRFGYGPVSVDGLGEVEDISGSTNGAGFFGGGQAGFNFQQGMFVFGIEADIQYSDIRGDRIVIEGWPAAFLNDVTRIDFKLQWFGTARGRIGIAHDRLLVYATGGLAYGQVKGDVRVTGTNDFDERDSARNIHVGYAVGGGAEYALANNWTTKLEYLYADLGSKRYDYRFTLPNDSTATATGTAKMDMHLLRIGLNYRF